MERYCQLRPGAKNTPFAHDKHPYIIGHFRVPHEPINESKTNYKGARKSFRNRFQSRFLRLGIVGDKQRFHGIFMIWGQVLLGNFEGQGFYLSYKSYLRVTKRARKMGVNHLKDSLKNITLFSHSVTTKLTRTGSDNRVTRALICFDNLTAFLWYCKAKPRGKGQILKVTKIHIKRVSKNSDLMNFWYQYFIRKFSRKTDKETIF